MYNSRIESNIADSPAIFFRADCMVIHLSLQDGKRKNVKGLIFFKILY